MPEAISDENRPVTLSVWAFLLAFVLVIIPSILTFGAFKLLGASEALSGVFVAIYAPLVVPLHQLIEKRLYVRKGISTARLNTPTRSPLRIFAYTTLIVFGFFGLTFLLSMVMGFAVAIAGGARSVAVYSGFVVGALASLGIPTASYLIGEWIGRSLARRRDALLVALGAPLLAITLSFVPTYFLMVTTEEAPEASQTWIEKESQSRSPITLPLALLSTIIPMLVGAIRGAKHKLFYDLAYFAKRLPTQKQEEIQDFVLMIGQDYATTSHPRPS